MRLKNLAISYSLNFKFKATAAGLKMIKDVNVDSGVLKLRSLETMEKAANGQATKLIIPADFQNMAGLVSSIKETVK